MLELYGHPFSPCTRKGLIALYANATSFTFRSVDDARPCRSYFPLGVPDRD